MKRGFSFPTGEFGKIVIVFGVDMNSSVNADNKKNIYILPFGEGPNKD